MSNKIVVPAGLILAGLLIAGAIVYTNYNDSQSVTENSSEESPISLEEAGEKVLTFINNNVLQGQGQGEASLVQAIEENGVYKVDFKVGEQEGYWRISKDGQLIFPQAINLNEYTEPVEEAGTTIGAFSVSSDEICREDDKPVIYFFGSDSCPHCSWEHPIIKEVMAKFEGLISFHDNMSNDEDREIFNKYSTGGVPAIVMGCQYYRVGSGEMSGEEEEAKNLTAITCKLTNNQPENICSEVQSLINEI